MKYKQLGLRVLSTAALMSIVTSIAASAFAGVYYVNDGDIDIDVDADGKVKVTQGGKTYDDANGEVIIRGGSAADYEDGRTDKGASKQEETTTIGETYTTDEEPEEEPAAEESEEPEEPEDVTEEAAEDEQPEPEASAEEQQDEPEEEQDAEPAAQEAAEGETTEEDGEETTETPAKREAPDTIMDGMTVDETTGKMSGYYVASGPKSQTQTDEDGAAKDIESTDHTISIKNDWVNAAKEAFKFILENVNIINTDINKAAMSVTGQGDTTVELDGNNVLKNTQKGKHAALEKSGDETQTGTLTITDEDEIDGDDSKRGSLTAATTGYSGAAIGGAGGNSGENIHITGNAYVNASVESGAAIGGANSYGYKKAGSDGNHIHIDGNAYVVAESRYDRAIGGSRQNSDTEKGGNANDIVISGTSTVYAEGGIGSGGSEYQSSSGNTDITIKGNSTVYANSRGNNYASSRNGGTTIGSGAGGDTVIKILEKAKVKSVIYWYNSISKKYCTEYGVGIGGYNGNTDVTIADDAIIGDGSGSIGLSGSIGENQETTSVTISGNATIGKLSDGAYIGAGTCDDENRTGKSINVLIKDNAWIKKVTRIGSEYAKTDVKILDNATIEELPGDDGHAIGSRYLNSTITLGGSSVEGEAQKGTVTINAGGKNGYSVIGAGCGANSDIKINGNVNLVLNSANGKYIMANEYTPVTDAQLKQMLEDAGAKDTTISYLDEEGNVTKIIHSSDLCEAEAGTEMSIDAAPTCTTPGKGHFTCAYEKNHGATGDDLYHTGVVENVEIPALGHDFGEWKVTTPATCTTKGVETRVCTRDASHTETRDISIDPTNHVHTKVVNATAETCGKKGYTGDTVCEDCGQTIATGHEIDATGNHSWNDGEVTTPATCTTAGVKTYTCTVCQATRTETIDALGHDFRDGEGEWKVTTPATCTTEGVETRYCHNNAEHTETRTISKLAHNFADGEWQTVTEATCTTEGTRVKKCKDCDALDTEHPETIPATGHAWGEWKETTAPKCEEVGEETRVCANDKTHVEHREVPATGHQHLTEGVNAKAPTANEPGYTGDTVCDDCGKVLENGTVIPATGSDDDSNAARELRVVVPSNTLRELLFTVSQKGGERTYTCKQDNATLTGTLETLQYLQSQGTDTIVFVTNGRVSRFAVADLLALCNEGDVFYLCHTADAEPTLLIIANDHTELLNK